MKNKGDYADLGLREAVEAIQDDQLSVKDYFEACSTRIATRERDVRAFVDLHIDEAGRRAYVLDRLSAKSRGAAHGVPVAVTEVIDVAGMTSSWGTPLKAGRVPSEDAAIVARLRDAGAIIMGVTASSEFGCFAAGPTHNPCNYDRSPGGASGGAAAAVASGMVPLSLGSQVDGSIIRPAAYCGVFGINPTRGAIENKGLMPLAPSFDGIGFFVRKAEDVGFLCRMLLGKDTIPESREELAYRSEGLTVRTVDGPLSHRIGASSRTAINRAATALSDARVPVEPLRLPPHVVKVEALYDIIINYEIAEQLGNDRDRSARRMSTRAVERVDEGRRFGAGDYEEARRESRRLRRDLLDLFEGETVFLDAATDGVAPPWSEGTGSPALQTPWTMTGAPVLAVPCGTFDGLPIGVQLIAAPGREDLLARVAAIIGDRPAEDD